MRRLLWKCLGAEGLPEKAKKNLGIVALLYFIQGAPVAILWEVLPVYFRLHGVSLRAIGGRRLRELPYALKGVWAPLVQRYGDGRRWVVGWMLGIHRRRVCCLEWLTLCPKCTALPQISHFVAKSCAPFPSPS